METFRCRACRKDYEEKSLLNRLRCPACLGPLLSHATLHQHEQSTREALRRLRDQSALTMAASALGMLVMQSLLSFLQAAEIAAFFNILILAVSATCLAAAALWWKTAQTFWMLCGAILLQLAAALFFFVVMGVVHDADGGHALPLRWELVIAALPMGGALLAWRQFRAYTQVLTLERDKGSGSRLTDL